MESQKISLEKHPRTAKAAEALEAKVVDGRDEMLDEIDKVLESIDEMLAVNFVQRGGQ